MFIVITGLDGSGTTSVATGLNEIDKNSLLFGCPSKKEYTGRKEMDESVSKVSPMAHMLYYISANAYMSDYIKKKTDYKNSNVYCVRYLIDTVVSNRVAGLNLDLDYNIFSANLLKPDLTLFVYTNEAVRSQRIENRGKDKLDTVLDDSEKRQAFLDEFQRLLDPKTTIFVDNSKDLQSVILKTYAKIHQFMQNHSISNESFSLRKITGQTTINPLVLSQQNVLERD